MTTALDVNRRGFLGLLFGAVVATAVAPIVAKVSESKWGALLRRLRGMSVNRVTVARDRIRAGDLADAFAQVERWDLRVQHVYLHPDTYDQLRDESDLFYDTGEGPSIWGATVNVTEDVERGEAYVMDSPDIPEGVARVQVAHSRLRGRVSV